MPALGALDIKILKVVPSFVDDRITTEDNEEDLRDSFASLATVQYRLFGSSRIRMGDLDVATSDYFRKVDRFKIVGRFVTCFSTLEAIASSRIFRNLVFTGPDGREYLWKLGERKCKARTSEACECKQIRLT